jgi:hypothetical protein
MTILRGLGISLGKNINRPIGIGKSALLVECGARVIRKHASTLILFIAVLLLFLSTQKSNLYSEDSGSSTFTQFFADDFSSYPQEIWNEGIHGYWDVLWNGYGVVRIQSIFPGGNFLRMRPKAATSVDETHSCLVTSTFSVGDFILNEKMKTINQLRTPTPNPWEVAWVMWHYQDNSHFYYFMLKENGWELGKEDPAYEGAQRYLATDDKMKNSIHSFHTITVNQILNHIIVLVDGTQVVDFTDNENPYLEGEFGSYTEDAAVGFDDVRIEY